MQLKQVIGIEKRYYNNLNQSESGFNSYWKIFLTFFVILIVIILFITCYRYIYGQIIYVCKRCLIWRNNENNTGDDFSVINESQRGPWTKRRFLWPNTCNFSNFHTKCDSQTYTKRKNKCKLKIVLQEKEKLLAPRDNKILASTNNVDLTKPISLDMTCSSSQANNKYKSLPNPILNRWITKKPTNFKRNKLSISSVENVHQKIYKCDKNIYFSDTDLRFLKMPLSFKTYNAMDKDQQLLQYKWNSGNSINKFKKPYNTDSKLIKLQLENANLFSNNSRKRRICTSKSSCSPCFFIPKCISTDTKYFSDSAPSRLNTLPDVFPRRSIISYTCYTRSNVSNRSKAKHDQILNANFNRENNTIEVNKLNDAQSQIFSQEYAAYEQRLERKMKSCTDILKADIMKVKNSQRISKSYENFVNIASKNVSIRNLSAEQSITSEKIDHDNDNVSVELSQNSELNQTFDELGILFSQYIKHNSRQCYRKYCPLKRLLKHGMQHSTKKCQIRFNYRQIYPYDQRPMCNSGNICADTYDELQLMCTLAIERKNVYQNMFDRRKHFLNEPCISSN